MSWVAVQQSVYDHRKTLQLCDELDISDVTAVGHLAKLWNWGVDNVLDHQTGELGALSARVIARAASWPGDSLVFLAALERCGWVDRAGQTLSVHDWYEHTGRMLLARLEQAECSKARRELRPTRR